MQTTIKSAITFSGIGLHTGAPVSMSVLPASGEYGIWFRRTDIESGDGFVPAKWDAVLPGRLCTKIANASGVEVSTVEHIMAALAGCGIHNALIEIDGPEVPILDGSSSQFVQAILNRGVRELDTPVRVIKVLQEVEVRSGGSVARISPSDTFEIDFQIDFDDSAIGLQKKFLDMANGAFVKELSNSRTFCRQSDVEAMRANGMALGGSLNNALVVDGDRVLTPGGMRYRDEAVRHKMLDALGDLALAGAPLFGRFSGHLSGHALTNKLLRELFSRPDAYRMTVCDEQTALRLPGVGVSRIDIPIAA